MSKKSKKEKEFIGYTAKGLLWGCLVSERLQQAIKEKKGVPDTYLDEMMKLIEIQNAALIDALAKRNQCIISIDGELQLIDFPYHLIKKAQ